jgi:hypothetical protein
MLGIFRVQKGLLSDAFGSDSMSTLDFPGRGRTVVVVVVEDIGIQV